jgi:hypothetical protein
VNDTPVSTTKLRWAVRILAGQAVAIFVLAGFVIWAAFTTKSISTTTAVATPLITVLFAAIYAGLAVALHQMRGWARGPAIVLELLLIPIGWYVTSGVAVVGVLVIVSGLAGAALLLAPSTRETLGLNR